MKYLPSILGIHGYTFPEQATKALHMASMRVLAEYLHPFWFSELLKKNNLLAEWQQLSHTTRHVAKDPSIFQHSRYNVSPTELNVPLEDYSDKNIPMVLGKKPKINASFIDKKIKQADVRGVSKLTSFFEKR